MNELDLLRKLAEYLRYCARHSVVDASQDINEDLYNLLQKYEEIRVVKIKAINEDIDFENEGC